MCRRVLGWHNAANRGRGRTFLTKNEDYRYQLQRAFALRETSDPDLGDYDLGADLRRFDGGFRDLRSVRLRPQRLLRLQRERPLLPRPRSLEVAEKEEEEKSNLRDYPGDARWA
jgi:hypothetical protein